MDSLILFLCFWCTFGLCFAVAELIDNVSSKLFRNTDLSWKEALLFPLLTILIWPLLLITLCMQLFFKKTFERMGKYLEKRTQYWTRPEWLSGTFSPSIVKVALCTAASDIWKKPGYEYDSRIELFVYRNRKTGLMRIASNQSTSSGKFILHSRYFAWVGQHNLFNCELAETYGEKE